MKKRLAQKIVVWATLFFIAGIAKVSSVSVAIICALGIVDTVLEIMRLTPRAADAATIEGMDAWAPDKNGKYENIPSPKPPRR